MKQQKRSLSEALQTVAIRPAHPIRGPIKQRVAKQVDASDTERQSISVKPLAREGKRLIGGHFDRSVARQLREVAAREESTVQALLAEAMNMLFAARGLPEIAEP